MKIALDARAARIASRLSAEGLIVIIPGSLMGSPPKKFWNEYSDLDYDWNVCYTNERRPRLTGQRGRRSDRKPSGAAGAAEGGNLT